jgi:hypothetical protein
MCPSGAWRGGVLCLHELLELGIELGLLLVETSVLAAHVIAASHCSVELVEEATVGATEVDYLRLQLAELPLLAHARPTSGLPVGDHPPPPPLLVTVDVFHATIAGRAIAGYGRCFAYRFIGSR